MKKEVGISLLILLLITSMPFILAEDNETDASRLNDAYTCLRDEIDTKECDNLGLEEKIFSVLAIGQCKPELKDSSDNDKCWPDRNCNVKSTAQSVLALERVRSDTSEAVDWLLSKKISPRDMSWYIQIDTTGASSCDIMYESNSNDVKTTVVFQEDKKIQSIAGGNCFSRTSSGDYWPEVARSCYGIEFQITCDQDFLTSLIFQKTGSSTIHVSDQATSSSPGGVTSETIESYCFSTSQACNYEGSLWATLALEATDEEIENYLPYLITLSTEEVNEKYLPDAFLYHLTGKIDYKTNILEQQKLDRQWKESTDEFYDTALALFPFKYEEPEEKTNAIDWLLSDDAQDEEGCWDNKNIRNTAFLLYSIWPRDVDSGTSPNTTSTYCDDGGGYCMSEMECIDAGGEVLPQYVCSSFYKCCSVDVLQQTCEEKGGDICFSNERCSGGYTEDSYDLQSGEECCLGSGTCVIDITPPQNNCVSSGGTCRTYGCNSDEEESSESCDSYSDKCCVEKEADKNYTWLWVLVILIIITIIAIIFKDSLRKIMFRLKPSSRRPGPAAGRFRPRPRGPPPEAPLMRARPMERRPMHAPAGRKPKGEIDDVLKKLKDMGR